MSERFETKKSLGQHFLNSPVVPRWLCDAAEIVSGEIVVEIGPGTGALTAELLERGARVHALEADARAITVLQNTFHTEVANGQLIIDHVDVRHFKATDLPYTAHTFKVVANIPYYLSGLLFRTFLATTNQPQTLVYLVQKEVAKRITTHFDRGEKESLLSLSVKLFGEPEYVRTVTRGHFTPPPKVDSAIIAVRNISRANVQNLSEDLVFNVLHLGFGQKRKQLLGNLAAAYDREALVAIFSNLSIDPTIRAEDMELDVWLRLIKTLPTK